MKNFDYFNADFIFLVPLYTSAHDVELSCSVSATVQGGLKLETTCQSVNTKARTE